MRNHGSFQRKLLSDPVFDGSAPRLRHKLAIHSSREELSTRYGRGRWHAFMAPGGIAMRNFSARIFAGARHAGSVCIAEYRIPWWTDANDFFYAMDSHSATTCELAEMILSYWPDPSEFGDFGNLVEITQAWMQPDQSGRERLGTALGALLDRFFAARSLLILQAFPLEYSGKLTMENEHRFRRRQLAMQRHYQAMVGVEPFPGDAGKRGWMFSIPDALKEIVAPPMFLGRGSVSREGAPGRHDILATSGPTP